MFGKEYPLAVLRLSVYGKNVRKELQVWGLVLVVSEPEPVSQCLSVWFETGAFVLQNSSLEPKRKIETDMR
jgi:hypothetical protein